MRATLWSALLLVIAPALSGCYLGHLALHQARLLRARQPIDTLLADPSTSAELRDSLVLAEEARAFAERLGLDVGDQYTSYVEWPGDRIVTTLVATPPGSVEPLGFWFPITGRVPYKGYFDADRAAAEAERLRAEGLDVCETPVPAYSTLGWMDDPVTGPMLRRGDGFLAETILHELVHANFYLPDDPDWNEGIARFIGEEASVRLFAESGRAARDRRAQVEEQRQIDAALLALRGAVVELYASQPPGPEREAARRTLEARTRAALGALPLRTLDPARLAAALPLNDACLALRGTYAVHLEGFREVLAALGGDLPAFVARARQASDADEPATALAGRPGP
jgi:predicted aminopeptidase